MLNTDEIAREATLIIQRKHPAWEGDAARNFESFMWRIAHDFERDEVETLARDMDANADLLAEEYGASPNRYRIGARALTEALHQRNISEYYKDKKQPGQPPPMPRR